VARAALGEGAAVVLADIDGEACRTAAAALGQAAVVMDVADAASVAEGVAAAAAALGGLDGLVNNAAILDESDAATVTLERFERVMAVNLTSILLVTQAALPHLMASGRGAVVNTLSVQALAGQPGSVAYATAKGGGLNLTRCLAIDLAPRGVRVNAVAPGFIDTRMAITADGTHEHQSERFRSIYLQARKIPLARPGTPEDCAGAFVFLLSDHSCYVTGQTLAVDGGLGATY
jgi:3-oxoacyl-[acyl-carrier protein] reductase